MKTPNGISTIRNTLNLTTDLTVTVDSTRTIGNLIFGDIAASSPGGWTLGGASTLTLDATPPTLRSDLGRRSAAKTPSLALSGASRKKQNSFKKPMSVGDLLGQTHNKLN